MILPNSIVALNRSAEELYKKASAPARAFVREAKTDELGYEKIYVEWDRNHWRHGDENDCWAFASHFTVLEEPEVSSEAFECDFGINKFIDAIEQAFETAAGGEGFMLISLERDPYGELYPKIMISTATAEAEQILSEGLPRLGL
jgi:hypothetical protein